MHVRLIASGHCHCAVGVAGSAVGAALLLAAALLFLQGENNDAEVPLPGSNSVEIQAQYQTGDKCEQAACACTLACL
jgi:hypothetical protein